MFKKKEKWAGESSVKPIHDTENELKKAVLKKRGIELSEWEAITEVDNSGGVLERMTTPVGWFVRYRNQQGRVLSGFVKIEDNTHEWEVKKDLKWITMNHVDPNDYTWMERYPVHNGWFVGQGMRQKRDFTHVAYFYDPSHRWGE